jgi:aerobic carbon-monoxide dehydrogenase large subunit
MTTEHTPGGFIGRSVRRVEDPVLITGKGCYVDDIQLPGMLHMAFLRSPYPHAKIVPILDTATRLQCDVLVAACARGLPPSHDNRPRRLKPQCNRPAPAARRAERVARGGRPGGLPSSPAAGG